MLDGATAPPQDAQDAQDAQGAQGAQDAQDAQDGPGRRPRLRVAAAPGPRRPVPAGPADEGRMGT